jgi:hypothetical protein
MISIIINQLRILINQLPFLNQLRILINQLPSNHCQLIIIDNDQIIIN